MTFQADIEAVYQQGKGRLPSEAGTALFLLDTGWTWYDYRTTPAHLIDKMNIIRNARITAENRVNK